MRTHTKLYGTLAAITLATLAIVGLTATGGAVVATENVTIDNPTNDTVEVDVDYSSSLTSDINATVELVNSSGTVVDSQTILGSPGTTETFALSASEAGDYTVDVTSTDETNTTLNETRIVASRTATIEDATAETLTIDLGFQGSTNATAAVDVTDSNGTAIYNTTVDYTGTETTKTLTLNDTDGLVNDTLSISATYTPASAYDGAYATVDDGTDSILGGTIAGQDTGVVLAVVIVAILGYLYVRRED